MNKIFELVKKEIISVGGGDAKGGISVRGRCLGLAALYSGPVNLVCDYSSNYRSCFINYFKEHNKQFLGEERMEQIQENLKFFESQCKGLVSPSLYNKITNKK